MDIEKYYQTLKELEADINRNNKCYGGCRRALPTLSLFDLRVDDRRGFGGTWDRQHLFFRYECPYCKEDGFYLTEVHLKEKAMEVIRFRKESQEYFALLDGKQRVSPSTVELVLDF